MKAIFIRHGQSTGNIGLPSPDHTLIALTDLGRRQAEEVAAGWARTPDLIVVSPYLRTQQTAAPTIARFPDAPVEVWPIQEFTYLQPSRWNGTLSAERAPVIARYWAQTDPTSCDGEGAESFSALLRRAEAVLARLAAMPEESLVYLFSHGQFIQAVRVVVEQSDLGDRGKMSGFWRHGAEPVVGNAERMACLWAEGWRCES